MAGVTKNNPIVEVEAPNAAYAEDHGVQESVSPSPPARGLKPAALQKIVDRFNADYKGAAELDIRVVADTAALEREVNRYEPRYRAAPNAEGAALDNIIWLVAENLPHGKRAREVILHEAVGHYGLKRMMGDSFTPLARFAMRRHGADMEKTAREYGFDLSTPEGQGRATEELLAQWAEKNPRMGLVRRFIAKFRQWLREVGFNIELSDNDIRALVAGAGRRMREGTLADRRARAEYVLREDAAAPAMSRGRGDVPVIQAERRFPSGWKDALRVHDEVRQRGPFQNREMGWKIDLTRASGKKLAGIRWKRPLLGKLDRLLEDAVYGYTTPNLEKNDWATLRVHRLFSAVNFRGDVERVKLVVKETKDHKFHYDLLLSEIEKPEVPAGSTHLPVDGLARETSGSTISISDLMRGVKIPVDAYDVVANGAPNIRESRAWHGSPHTFDRFSTERVGTGEGYQMYGWGLYFASAKDVAKNYQKERSDGKYQYDVVLSEINQAALSPIKLPGSVSGQDGETAALTINIDDLMRGVKIPVDAHDVRDIPGARESLRLYSSGAAEYNQKPGFAEYHERLLDTRRDTKTSPPAPVAFSIVQVAILAGSRFETPGNVGYACNALQAQGGESWLTN